MSSLVVMAFAGVIAVFCIKYSDDRDVSIVYNYIKYKYDFTQFNIFYWDDLSSENQIDYWPNKKLKVRYDNIDSTRKVRYDYNQRGELIRKSKIHQIFACDKMMLKTSRHEVVGCCHSPNSPRV